MNTIYSFSEIVINTLVVPKFYSKIQSFMYLLWAFKVLKLFIPPNSNLR